MAGKVRRTGAAAVSTGGSPGGSLISDAKLQQLYATMLHCRLLTERARSPRNHYAASLGQEAIATGCTIDLQPGDTIALAPRDSIASLVKGVGLRDLVAQRPKPAPNIIPASSSSLSAAITVAAANRKKKSSHVVIAFTNKRTTLLSSWHQALQTAAKSNLPIIFVVQNNPWEAPASAKVSKREEDSDLKARSYGFPVITVDGNDVVAVYRVAHESLERVRQGGGPVLVEGKTYRLQGRAMKPQAWRTERDPLTHLERYLKSKGLFTAGWKNQVADEFSRQLDAEMKSATRYLRASGPPAND